jgi:type II secretory pathway pseudopilin PulG
MVTPWPQRQSGMALVVVLLAMGILGAAALGLTLSSTLSRLTVTNHDEAVGLANASESALELAARELALIGNWDDVLLGTQASTLVDGAPGLRTVTPGITIDLVSLTNQLTCGQTASCSDAQVRATTRERPWGANNPRWRLFVHQPLSPLPMPAVTAPVYVVVWLGDDAAEVDGDPLADGAGPAQDGRYIVRARAESFGSRGGRHAIEAELARVCVENGAAEACAPGIRVQSWRVVASGLP